ncbi:MAG: hypothetical protein DDG59_10690 [Anaerolineae bacterium]|jgi:hypothetical protein|nr:MAG: hypothetical protein DDG59_10690 [Anaerolineae bacterium]
MTKALLKRSVLIIGSLIALTAVTFATTRQASCAALPGTSAMSRDNLWQHTNPAQPKAEHSSEAARMQGGIAAAVSGLSAISFLLLQRLRLQGQVDTAAQALKAYNLPPQALPPGLAAHLCGSSQAALATLFDLAQRGFLRIEEKGRERGQPTFEIVRLPAKEPLQPHEEVFLETLFRFRTKDRVPLSQITQLAYTQSYRKALEDELIVRGWSSVERTDQRLEFASLSGAIMAIGLLLFAVGLGIGWGQSFGAILIGAAGGLLLAGFAGIVLSLSISTLTDEGIHQAAQWQAFASSLKELAENKSQHHNAQLFERYLPYAAGFGFLAEWLDHLSIQGKLSVPDWFYSERATETGGRKEAWKTLLQALCAAVPACPSAAAPGRGSSETVLGGIR